jgi:hypothetical protein
VARLTRERSQLGERGPGLPEVLDRVDLPGEVVVPDAPRCALGLPDAEEAEVVMVAGGRQPQECSARPRLLRDDRHTEHPLVEREAALEVSDKQDGVV